MPIDVVATRDLVACKKSQLTNVATKHEVSDRVAGYVRRHWTRRVTNRCVHCNTVLYKKKRCPKCKKPVESPLDLLQGLPTKVVLIRTSCATCGREMSFRAGHMLKVTKQHGFFRPPLDCPRCKAKKLREEEKAKQPKPAEQPKKKARRKKLSKKQNPQSKKKSHRKKAQAPEPWYHSYMNDGELRNRPFMVLKDLKIEK